MNDPVLLDAEVEKVMRLKKRKLAFQFAEKIIGYAAAEWTDEDLQTFEKRLLKNVYNHRKDRIAKHEEANPPA